MKLTIEDAGKAAREYADMFGGPPPYQRYMEIHALIEAFSADLAEGNIDLLEFTIGEEPLISMGEYDTICSRGTISEQG